MATAKELLAVAVRQLNVREDPPGSNNVRYNTWYYGREVSGNAYPWCMAFVQWVFAQAGVKLPTRTASCGGGRGLFPGPFQRLQVLFGDFAVFLFVGSDILPDRRRYRRRITDATGRFTKRLTGNDGEGSRRG